MSKDSHALFLLDLTNDVNKKFSVSEMGLSSEESKNPIL